MSKVKYITKSPVIVEKLTCNHPKVENIWEYGGLSSIPTSSEIIRVVCILMIDRTVIKFMDDVKDTAIEKAEEYLKSIK